MIKRLIQLSAAVSLIALVALACGGGGEPAPTPQRESPPPPEPAPATAPTEVTAVPVTGQPDRTIAVDLADGGGPGPFVFGPADLNIATGERIRFQLKGESQFHTFTVEDLAIDVEVDGGSTVDFDFTFDQPGTYTLICIPHESLGIVGTITVSGAAAATPEPEPAEPEAAPPTKRAMSLELADGGGRGPFAFEPADLTFSTGETVEFTFNSDSQFHTFTVDELGIDVEVDSGAPVNFEYTFDKPGTYTLVCIRHEGLGMVGTITVQ